MINPGTERDNTEKGRERIWNSICHTNALSMLLLSGNDLEEADGRRNLELSKYVVKVLKDPILVASFALSLVKGVARLIAVFMAEEELRRESVKYLKISLKKIKNAGKQPSSAEEFENEFGSWLMQVMNTIISAQVLPREEAETRIAERGLYLNVAPCSFIDFAHIGLVLHKWSFNKLFHSLPDEAFSPESVRDLVKRLLAYEAQFHPELNEALEILD